MRLEFLKEHGGEIGLIKKVCGLMKVSKSGFYEYLCRKKSNARIEREALEGFVVEALERHKGRYGYRRINRELRKSGIVVSEKRVLRIMQKLGLAGKDAARKHSIQNTRGVLTGDFRSMGQRPVKPIFKERADSNYVWSLPVWSCKRS